MTPQTNGWNEWSRHVLAELERLDKDIHGIEKKLDEIKEAIITLKVKVALIGGAAGLVVGGIISFVVRSLTK
jgi:hypothetical protein